MQALERGSAWHFYLAIGLFLVAGDLSPRQPLVEGSGWLYCFVAEEVRAAVYSGKVQAQSYVWYVIQPPVGSSLRLGQVLNVPAATLVEGNPAYMAVEGGGSQGALPLFIGRGTQG